MHEATARFLMPYPELDPLRWSETVPPWALLQGRRAHLEGSKVGRARLRLSSPASQPGTLCPRVHLLPPREDFKREREV